MKQEAVVMQKELDGKDQIFIDVGSESAMPSDAALGALLEDGSPAADAEGRVRRLAERLARLDALNVAGMLAAASEGGGAGARLGARLDAGLAAGAGLAARLRRCEAVVRAAPDAAHARSGAARTDANARALLAELEDLYGWLDAPPLRDLDSISEISLASPEGRASALAAGNALRAALRAEKSAPAARRRLGGRALACFSRRVVAGADGEARWARAALAGGAVAAKRHADRAVAERLAALPDAVKQAARRPKCGLLSFLRDFEELSGACEAIFSGGRRADLDRWYVSLASAMMHAIQHAEHPRTPRAVLHMENYHRLHGILSAVRVAALEALRRESRARYSAALKAYVTQYFGRPLEKLTQFFEGVAEAVAGGVREDEVCYRAAFSKHELKRLLAMYPAPEVRKSLHRLYRTVEKHLSEEGGLLQVVWRAMQEEFLAQHLALQSRIATCYPGAGLAMPLTTQDILDAFSDIAREH
ncbi:hypothetical protein ABMA27_002921 [Loxostege sticticalis]|uniref:Exocyst complex component Sec3 C-terminal domain-containing protein n=1 Tax=Loxostege sticticalis TaxID=481309 RepID=A0ABR3HVD4_LOXSC